MEVAEAIQADPILRQVASDLVRWRDNGTYGRVTISYHQGVPQDWELAEKKKPKKPSR